MTTISVAMATYNGVRFLPEQLESIARQRRPPDEMIVTDDLSTDGSVDLIKRWSLKQFFKVSVHVNAHRLGYARNFERATGLCRGDLIFWADQDDRWDDGKLGSSEALFQANPGMQVVLADARLCDSDLRRSGLTQLEALRRAGMSDENYIMGCASGHRREWSDALLPLPDGETHDFWINSAAHVAGVAIVDLTARMDYRRHGLNASETLLSDPQGASSLNLLRHAGFVDQRASYRAMAQRLRTLQSRLSKMGLVVLPAEAAALALKTLDFRIAAQEARASIPAGRLERVRAVARMWRRGDYRCFAGWKSALKDLIRP